MPHSGRERNGDEGRDDVDEENGARLRDAVDARVDVDDAAGEAVVLRLRRSRVGLGDADADALEDSLDGGRGGDAGVGDDGQSRFRRSERREGNEGVVVAVVAAANSVRVG